MEIKEKAMSIGRKVTGFLKESRDASSRTFYYWAGLLALGESASAHASSGGITTDKTYIVSSIEAGIQILLALAALFGVVKVITSALKAHALHKREEPMGPALSGFVLGAVLVIVPTIIIFIIHSFQSGGTGATSTATNLGFSNGVQ